VNPVCVHLLLVEVSHVLLKDVVRRPVRLAQVLQELKDERGIPIRGKISGHLFTQWLK
jgi:hypothetical protein